MFIEQNRLRLCVRMNYAYLKERSSGFASHLAGREKKKEDSVQ